jgi:hypothetical protein
LHAGLFSRSWDWALGVDLALRWRRQALQIAVVPSILVEHIAPDPWPADTVPAEEARHRLRAVAARDELDVRRIVLESGTELQYFCTASSGPCIPHLEVVARGLKLPPCCAQHLGNMVRRLSAALKARKIVHTWTGGTVLGALKEGGLLPWDSDADVAVEWRGPETYFDIAEALRVEFDHVLEACWRSMTSSAIDCAEMHIFGDGDGAYGLSMQDFSSLTFMRLHFSSRHPIWIDIYPMTRDPERGVFTFPAPLFAEGLSEYPVDAIENGSEMQFGDGGETISIFRNPGLEMLKEIGPDFLSDKPHSYHSKDGVFTCGKMWDGVTPHHSCVSNVRK